MKTNNDVLDLFSIIKKMKGHLGVKFNMALCANLFHMEEICKPLIEESKRIQDLIKDYTKERIELAKKYAQKDAAGKPKIIATEPPIFDLLPDDQKKLDEETKVLRETKYKDQFEIYDKETADFLKVLEGPCDKFKPTMIAEDLLPNTLVTEEIKAMYSFIQK